MLSLGYARPLEPTDLWKLENHRSAAVISKKILDSFQRRSDEAENYNVRLANGQVKPGLQRLWWSLRGKTAEREKQWREKNGVKKPSLVWAMNDSVKWWFWSSGVRRAKV